MNFFNAVTNIDESWGHLTIEGNYHDDVCKIFTKIIELFETSSCGNAFAITFNGSIINKTELNQKSKAMFAFTLMCGALKCYRILLISFRYYRKLKAMKPLIGKALKRMSFESNRLNRLPKR